MILRLIIIKKNADKYYSKYSKISGDDLYMNSVTSIYPSRITIDEPVKRNMGLTDDIVTGVVMEKK